MQKEKAGLPPTVELAGDAGHGIGRDALVVLTVAFAHRQQVIPGIKALVKTRELADQHRAAHESAAAVTSPRK